LQYALKNIKQRKLHARALNYLLKKIIK